MFLRALLALALTVGQFNLAFSQGINNPGYPPGQNPGTTTNDNANAGNVAQFIEAQCPRATATITVTIATPAVVTWTGHLFSNVAPRADNCAIVFTNSGGALPTGITASTTYYIIASTISGNTFQIATTVDNALAGTAVATSGSQSGTQTGTSGVNAGSSTAVDITGLSLTAGDWSVCGNVVFTSGSGTVATIVSAWVNTVAHTFPAPIVPSEVLLQATFTATGTQALSTACQRFPLSATTTVYLEALTAFTVNTMNASGFVNASRRR